METGIRKTRCFNNVSKTVYAVPSLLQAVLHSEAYGSGYSCRCRKTHTGTGIRPRSMRQSCRRKNCAGLLIAMGCRHLLHLFTSPQPVGIFCHNDLAAGQTLQVCRARGIAVPEQLKVIGFDDIPLAAMTSPSLSSIHQPILEMATLAVDIVCDLGAEKVCPSNVVMPVSVVQRETT